MIKFFSVALCLISFAHAASLEITFLDGSEKMTGEIENIKMQISKNNGTNNLNIEAGFGKSCFINRSSFEVASGSQPPFEGLNLLVLSNLIKTDMVDIKCTRKNKSDLEATFIEVDYK